MDLTGQKFGRYIVLKFDHISKSNGRKYLCLCECGKEKLVSGSKLKAGSTVSCGCFHKEVISKQFKKHGDCDTRLYYTWCGMLSRCNLKTHANYDNYGGRGIKVCQDWNEYLNFKNWALDNGYNTDKTIDRIDNDKGYYPLNCRWATLEQQTYNKRTTVFCLINGELLNTKQIADKYGINKKVIYYRLSKGMKGEEIIKPIGKTGRE